MQRTVEKAFFALLRFEINGTELCDDEKNLITSEMLPALHKLSKRHDLAHLIGDALDKNGLLPDGSEAQKRFLQERNMAIYRHEQMQYEYDQLCEILEKEQIPFLPLKGSIIRSLYPQPWMRTSCDIDILVKEADLERTIEALKNALTYETGARGSHDVSLFSPSGVHLELHFSLTEADDRWKEILTNVWSNPYDGYRYRFTMTDGMFYFYHIAHMAIHMRTGGCGVKPFLDLYVLLKAQPKYRQAAKTLLKKGELSAFEATAKRLSEVWFTEAEKNIALDELTDGLQSYVLRGGVYGTLQNRVAVQQMKKGGKLRYLLSRVFISFSELSIKYPSLKKRKLLFPFYQIYRWFDLWLNKNSRRYTKATIRQTQKTTDEKLESTERLFQKIGL